MTGDIMKKPDSPRKRGRILDVLKMEVALFRGRPMLWLAAATISLIPALYSVIYLGALWDPYGNVDRIPAGLVNLDRGTQFRGGRYNLGERLVKELRRKKPFTFVEYDSAAGAEKAVRSGEVYFALVVPAGFSGRALPGTDIGSLTLITSQGTSYIATLIAGRFAGDAAEGMNDELVVERWRAVLGSDVVKGIDTIHNVLTLLTAEESSGKQSPEDMAMSVRVKTRDLAPVSSNGPGFAPYFMALSLWLGALMPAFLFHLIVFPRSVAAIGNTAKIAGKGIIPLMISLSGAVLLGLTVQYVLKIPVVHPAGFYLVLLLAVATYTAIILSLVRCVGDAGKLLAVLLLVVQIASSGGAYPIETSPAFYRAVSPYLPMTHVVDGLRAAIFGSYNGGWAVSLLFLLPWIAVSLCISFLSSKRFRYVDDADYGPALDL